MATPAETSDTDSNDDAAAAPWPGWGELWNRLRDAWSRLGDAWRWLRAPRLRHSIRLFMVTLAVILDVGLLVAGAALVGLAVVVVLAGLDLVAIRYAEGTGPMLGAGLVIAVVGGFALGVAAEGPIGRRVRRVEASDVERALVRAAATLVIGVGMLLLATFLRPFTAELPGPLEVAIDVIQVTGVAGLTAALVVGVPAAWGIRQVGGLPAWLKDLDEALLFVVWAIGAAVVYAVMF